jgi:hypothetical protein
MSVTDMKPLNIRSHDIKIIKLAFARCILFFFFSIPGNMRPGDLMIFFRVALCTGVTTEEIHQQAMFHVAKTSRREVGSGFVRRVKTIKRVFSSAENLIPALFSIPCLTNLMISCLLVGSPPVLQMMVSLGLQLQLPGIRGIFSPVLNARADYNLI